MGVGCHGAPAGDRGVEGGSLQHCGRRGLMNEAEEEQVQ